jgi:uncharacterized protein YjaG (DUF416 family)
MANAYSLYVTLPTIMNYPEFISAFKNQVSALPYRRQLEFAIAISKTLFPEYQAFFEYHNWGNPDLLLDAINMAEQSFNSSIEQEKIEEMIPKIDSIVPHMDDYGDEIGSYGLNASAAVYETLQFILDKDQTHIYNIGIYYTNTIDFKIQEEQELSDDEIDQHPLMIQAWNYVIEQTN